MLYPSIQEILKATEKDGEERLNKYSVTMATAKCARMVTDEYVHQREIAEKLISAKETDKSIANMIDKEYRDEKAVKVAINHLYSQDFAIVGYDDELIAEAEQKKAAAAAETEEE